MFTANNTVTCSYPF